MKRKSALVAVLCTVIILGYISFISWLIGFLLSKYLGSNEVGEPSKIRSYFIPLGRYKIHLHHWLLSSLAIIIFAVFNGAYILPPALFYGFFGAIAFHGIYCYSDWYKVLIPRQVPDLIAEKNLVTEEVPSVLSFSGLERKSERD